MDDTLNKPDLSALRISHDKKESAGESRSKMKYVVISGVFVLILVVYFVLKNQLAAAIEVEVTTASLTSPSQANTLLNASGYVVAQQKASVASKATGRLEYLGVEEGDHVKKGQVIARLEDQDVKAALEQAKANLATARADFNDAEQTLNRQRTLFASGLTSKAELDAAEARYQRVLATIKSGESAVVAAEVAVENTRIRAPFDGTVLTKNADVGEVVAPFAAAANSRAAVVTIADMSSLLVEADVSESNITRVSPGQPCEIVLDAYPDKRYAGFVHKIVPTADRAKATVLTKVRFKELDHRVLPEMSAKVSFLSKPVSQQEQQAAFKLTVPTACIVSENGDSYVFLVSDQRVSRVQVKSGELIGTRIEIREGLKQGDQVVVRPESNLSSGAKVKVKS